MADKRTRPRAPEAARRGKGTAPTIDLTATEVKPMASEPQPQAIAEPPSSPPPQKPPPVNSDVPPADAGASGEMRKVPGRFFTAPTLAAGAAGAVFIAIILFALWLTGLVPIRYAGSTAMRARVTGLEMQMHDLQNRPAGAVDNKAVDALSQRIGKIEDAITKLPVDEANVGERLAAADNAMKALGVALAALTKRSDDIAGTATQARERAELAQKAVAELGASVQAFATDAAKYAAAGMSPAELDVLQKRVAALEQSAKSARDDIAKTTATDTAVRLALTAAVLREVVESGAPFAAEFAQAQSLSANDKALAPLADFAVTGVPTAPALAQDLRALLPALVKLWDTQPPGNFLERLQVNASKLVRVRPVDAPSGDDASTLLARLEVEAAKADIAAAISDLGKLNFTNLTDVERSPVQLWINKAKARQAALAAARQFAAATARALGTK